MNRILVRFATAVFIFGLMTRVSFADLSWAAIVGRSLLFGILFEGAMFFIEGRRRN